MPIVIQHCRVPRTQHARGGDLSVTSSMGLLTLLAMVMTRCVASASSYGESRQ